MLFYSPIFLFYFLPTVFILYFYVNKSFTNYSSIILIISGLIFYAWWNIYLTPIIVVSIFVNYFFSKKIIIIEKKKKKKKILIYSIIFNILYLVIFKYVDFLILNINYALSSNIELLNLPFPLALSFVTFQTIAYLVDCYDDEISNISFKKYALFIIFFPQLIAGPIVKYNFMSTQFENIDNKKINNFNIMLGLIILAIGFIKKVLIANNLAIVVDNGYALSETLNFLDSWLISLSFTFQLYFDFGGYIDMATGIALLFNIRIPQNFNSPYKASSIIDFWQRWHMTLTSFLTSYIYFPILRSLKIVTFFRTMIVTIVVFFIAGIWHGPTWFYILFGLFHGLGIIINHCYIKFFNKKLNYYFSWFLTFNFVNVSLVFFRSEETAHTINILKNMYGFNGFDISNYNEYNLSFYITFLVAITVCLFFKNTNYLIEESYKKNLSNKKNKG